MITTRTTLWALSVCVMLAGVAAIAAKTWQMNRAAQDAVEASEASLPTIIPEGLKRIINPPADNQPYWGIEPSGRKFYVNTKGEKEYRDGTFSTGVVLSESWNTSGSIEAILRDDGDTYLLTREGDMLRVSQVRKGQPNRTLALFAAPLEAK